MQRRFLRKRGAAVSVLALSGANAPALPKGEPLAVHANFISLPRPLPLGEVSPQVTERARMLSKSKNTAIRCL